jgi:hypothetical protein
VGSYAKSFFVGGREFELYAEHGEQGEVIGYELICVLSGRKVNDGLLLDEPEQADVEAQPRGGSSSCRATRLTGGGGRAGRRPCSTSASPQRRLPSGSSRGGRGRRVAGADRVRRRRSRDLGGGPRATARRTLCLERLRRAKVLVLFGGQRLAVAVVELDTICDKRRAVLAV